MDVRGGIIGNNESAVEPVSTSVLQHTPPPAITTEHHQTLLCVKSDSKLEQTTVITRAP